MKPYKVEFYVYSENEKDVVHLKKSLYDFVMSKYNKGVLVTARKMSDAIDVFGNNPLVTKYFNGKHI